MNILRCNNSNILKIIFKLIYFFNICIIIYKLEFVLVIPVTIIHAAI